jgi:hypothetical protein
MRWTQRIFFCFITGISLASSAYALCIYHGEMNAKTTVAQEFADSQWVVRMKLIAADDHWSMEEDSWTIYHLQVLTAFKGEPPTSLEMFTYRDSGGFFLDKGVFNDLGGEYLLFLDPISHKQSVPAAALNATEVNYSCDQSKTWVSVTKRSNSSCLILQRRNSQADARQNSARASRPAIRNRKSALRKRS